MSPPAEKLARVNDPGFFIPGLWWTPERIAFHNGQGWKTVPWQKFIPKGQKMQTLAVSPVGTDGLCRFIAWDIDDNNPVSVRKLVSGLPPGCVPLVSASGRKGFHLWLFPTEPLPVQTAVAFAKAIREKAGIPCEIFPSSKRSKCLKWPLSVHPETGLQELFVPLDNLNETERLDTSVILQMLSEGYYRTPSNVIEAFVEANTPKPKAEKRATKARPAQQEEGHTLPTGKLLPEGVNLATIPEIAFGLAELCGRHVSRIGQAFRCILPGHQERRPSSAFCYGDNGTIVYHCFHYEKHGTPEFLTLAEVYYAVATSQIRKLSRVEASKWLCRLALRLGFQTQAVVLTKEKLTALDLVLIELGLCKQRVDIYSPVVCKNKRVKVSEAKRIKDSRDLAIEKVWHVLCEEALLSALAGFNEIKLSARFLAEEAGLPLDLANRAINLLAVLGVVEKVPGSGGMKGDRFILGNVTVEEAKRRLNALFPNGRVDLREFKAKLVAERLGEETAKAIFRRQCGTIKGTVRETVSQTVGSLLAEIQAAEAVGDWERVKHLQRLFMEEVRKSKGRPAEIPWSSPGIPLQYLGNTLAMP